MKWKTDNVYLMLIILSPSFRKFYHKSYLYPLHGLISQQFSQNDGQTAKWMEHFLCSKAKELSLYSRRQKKAIVNEVLFANT